jgi:type II secretory pathway pseudopilin PulG
MKMNLPTRRFRGGFTLLSMLAVLFLLGVGALLATRLFASSMRVTASSQDTHTRALRFDNMLDRLRQDVWSASAIEPVDAQTIDLRHAGSVIRWQVHSDATVTRTAPNEPQHRWPLAVAAIRFEPRPAGLFVHVREDKSGVEQSIPLISQLLLAGGVR